MLVSFWQSATIEGNYILSFAFYLDQTYSSAPFSSDAPDCSFASPSQLYGFLDLLSATKYFQCFLNQGAVKCLSFSLTSETPVLFVFTLPNAFPPACRHHLSKVHSNTCVQRDTDGCICRCCRQTGELQYHTCPAQWPVRDVTKIHTVERAGTIIRNKNSAC